LAGQQQVVPKLTLSQVQELVSSGVPDSTMSNQIQKRGLAFAPTPAILESLRAKGAGPLTLEAVEALFPQGTRRATTESVDSGPSLSATMQFIQDKLHERGQITWVLTMNPLPGVIRRDTNLLVQSDISADPATCTLRSTETTDESTVRSGADSADSALQQSRSVETQTVSFKEIETVTIGSPADIWNTRFAKAGHPERTASVEPPVFEVVVSGSKAAIPLHLSVMRENQAPQVIDQTLTTARFTFRDEEMANRVANAMHQAVRLCGGGNKEPF
jgi:hypothetical protein